MSGFIAAKEISYSISGKKILDSASLTLKRGEFLSILGENGAGKSTLLKCIMKIISDFKGKVVVDDIDLSKISSKELAQKISFVPQGISLEMPFTVKEFMEMSRYPYLTPFSSLSKKDYDSIEKALTLTDTLKFKERQLNSLSGGERQRVFIAGSIAQETPFILLDEPASFLDPSQQIHIYQILKEIVKTLNYGILMVSHDINSAALWSDRIVGMKNGKTVFCGESKEIMKPEVIDKLFDHKFSYFKHPQTDINLILPEIP